MSRVIKFRASYLPEYGEVGLFDVISLETVEGGWVINGEIPSSAVHLMQSTGLIDKNGKEMYEGDVVRNWECQMALHSIEWIKDGFFVNYHNYTHGVIHPSLLEVAGNIHENSELLKRDEKENA